jgi:hypothetical protein
VRGGRPPLIVSILAAPLGIIVGAIAGGIAAVWLARRRRPASTV